jgi:signal transduction histidine kinase/DNA-binding response OmpR family regulator
MSLRLTGQAVEAEKQVRRLNVELEQRVEKRTAELSMAKTKAEVANRAKSTFLANMSHELRTPLNAILGHAQIMFRDQSLKPDMRHSIEAVNRSGDHLLVLINNVLEMSKIEAGKTVLSPAPFDIDSLLSDMEMMFRDRIIEKGLKFKVTKETETPRVISADRGKISQILINIVSNAIRYTREGGITLIVSVVRANSVTPHLVFEVKDTGEGLEAENLELIFEPFRQSGEVSPQQSGTGLGLAISRQYARMMDGELTVESQVGQGSIFRFMIPAVQAKLAPRETGLTPLQQIVSIAGERREYRVLVVDDEPSNRDVLIRLLSPVGFDIREAGGGQEAIALFESWSPHLILMDIRMPIMDGIEAIQTIKSTGQGRVTPIIGVSASVFKEDKNKVLESGADDFIAKPIQEAELWKKIGQCLKVELLFDDKKRLAADRSETLPLTRERMAGLPKELVEDMRAAVQGGYMERLAELAKQAAVIHPELSEQFLKIIYDYDYETLSRLFLEDGEGKQGSSP